MAACSSEQPQPSVLLFVYDTVRHDATAPYGAPTEVTPTLDRLGREGLVYDNAYAHAPWTLPSHVSLFSGLLPSQHGTGVRSLRAADELEMLAEAMSAAGYQTRAISENPWVGPEFNVTQGFERFELLPQGTSLREFEAALDAALADRDPKRPMFLFVNVMDAHGPYQPHSKGRFVAPATTPADVAAALKTLKKAFCSRGDDIAKWRPLWWQMYLSGVRDADDKLGAAWRRLESPDRRVVTVATSDHGQAFGEHHLTSHMFSIREPLIRVPLIVHGLGVRPTRIADAVGSINVRRSILDWAKASASQGEEVPPLPEAAGAPGSAPVVSEYFDTASGEIAEQSMLLRLLGMMRDQCTAEDRVEGDMRAVVRHPHKLISYTRYPTELFDLDTDPGELHDLAAKRPELARELAAILDAASSAAVDASQAADPSSETLERLRALGYGPSDGAGGEAPAPP